jgi:hypothetical protein
MTCYIDFPMKSVHKNKFLLGLLFAAVLGLTVFLIGGEYLHSCIHDHHDQASHDQCPVSQLQIQSFLAFSVIITAVFLRIILPGSKFTQLFFPQTSFNLRDLRAPPVSFL